MTRCCLLILFYWLSLVARIYGQNLSEQVIQPIRNKPVKRQLELLDSLAVAFRAKDLPLSKSISRFSISQSKKSGMDSLRIRGYLVMSKTYRSGGSIDTALLFLDSAKAIVFDRQFTSRYAFVVDFEGVLRMRKGEYENAARCFYESISYAEKNQDSMAIKGAFEHLGSLNFYRKDYRGALRFYQKALSYSPARESRQSYFSTLDNLGLAYSNLKMLDSALYYQKRGFKELEKTADSATLAESCVNIGTTLLAMKNTREAEQYLVRGYAMQSRIHNEYGIQVSSLYLGRLYLESGRAEKALAYLEQAYAIAKRLKVASQIRETLQALTEGYRALGDYKKAAEHYAQLLQLIEEAHAEENSKAINELSAKYETEKKQQQIQLLTADRELKQQRIEKDRYINLLTAGIALLLLALSLVFIFRFRKKKKDNALLTEKNLAIARQKSEIETQKELLQNKNREITDSINYARRIQGSVLPSHNLVKKSFPQSFIYFQPKDIVSGDFYWLNQSKEYIYFAVADCTGHGVPGAMMSMLGTALLNQIVSGASASLPSDILRELHHHVLRTLNENMEQRQSKDGMDIALIRLNLQRKELLYAGSGRSLYVLQNNELITYKADKHAIGSEDAGASHYTLHTVDWTSPLQLFLFSDGVPDQFGGPKGKKLMTRNLLQLLVSLAPLPIADQENEFTRAFENWKKGYEQTDDITLVSVRLS